MTAASYPHLALLLQYICLSAIYTPSSYAAIPIGQNIQTLVDTLTLTPDIRYNKSTIVACYIAVDYGDHDPDHFKEFPLSSNIGEFRDIRCVFRYGGPIADENYSLFFVKNKWPFYWDQWESPGDAIYFPYHVEPFSWRKAVSYMSAERANRLLKASGQLGPYALVSMVKTMMHPDGAWCFLNVQILDSAGGGQRTYIVDVRTGRVEETEYCQTW